MMFDVMPPYLVLFFGALLLAIVSDPRLRSAITLVAPTVCGAMIWQLPIGEFGSFSFGQWDLTLLRVDKLSKIFALIFAFAAFLSMVFAWHVKGRVEPASALVYAGAAIGAVFAGDFITLFVFWEGTAIASVFLIWARNTDGAFHTGIRYLLVQITSGVLLLGGMALIYRETGSIAFDSIELGSLASWAILIAFGIKCAFPLLHNWLHDAYPAATITGTVILSAFTTKLAVYALARGFAGTELLITIGVIMALFPIVFALLSNDLRRTLTYGLNSQQGFMVAGIGIGTPLALNGTVSHAVASVLYMGLLFMCIGAVMHRTGTSKATQLGGLYKHMPITALFCAIGAASIAAFPLFSGFVTKSAILSAAAKNGFVLEWILLLGASAAVFLHTGLKVTYFTFFGDRADAAKTPVKEAPKHMLWAMGLTAFMCVAIGVFPNMLYSLLPFDKGYHAYSLSHIVTQLQLLVVAAVIFFGALKLGYFPKQSDQILLDTDWMYRKLFPSLIAWFSGLVTKVLNGASVVAGGMIDRTIASFYSSHGPEGRMARVWPNGVMVLWIAIILAAMLLVNFI